MSKYFKLRSVVFFFVTTFLMMSCANNDSKTTDTSAPASTTTPTSTDATPATTTANKTMTLTGTLATLWVESAIFAKLDNKNLFLSFRFEAPDILTLHGWSCQGVACSGGFPNEPNLKLVPGPVTTVTYGPNVYFGNLLVDDVKKIKKKAEKFANVVFVPLPKVDDYIRYRVFVTNDPRTKAFTTLSLEDTEVDANPSPPKH